MSVARRPIEHLGASVPYSEGVEDELLATLTRAIDRHDGSDELSSRITNWPTRYHFSPLRSNLLRPLDVRPGMRVLDVGCGSGTTTRYLAERGADVVALEGNPVRAAATAERCAGLENVRVVCGPLEEFRDESLFDLVLVVGVLEYSDRLVSDGGHRRFVRHLVELTAPHGALALAIENQLGLKYLLGHQEDHLGLAWVGVEGYRRAGGVQTWSRRALGQLLSEGGLPSQRWLYPFPDYKLPTTVIDESLYRRADGPAVVDRFLRDPVVDHLAPGMVLADERAAHRVFLHAGLGEDVANSFFVVAARSGVELPVESGLAFMYGGQRLREFRRARTIQELDGQLQLIAPREYTASVEWLSIQVPRAARVVDGTPLDVLLDGALVDSDLEAFGLLVREWWSLLGRKESARTDVPSAGVNPFLLVEGGTAIDGQYLDANFDNFVRTAEGDLVFVDTELSATPAVHLEAVAVRAMRVFALRATQRGLVLPWPGVLTVDEVVERLWSITGLPPMPLRPADLAEAEGELQRIVTGAEPGQVASDWRSIGERTAMEFGATGIPVTRLQDAVSEMREDRDRTLGSVQELIGVVDDLRSEVTRVETLRARDADELRTELERVEGARLVERDDLLREIGSGREHAAEVERELRRANEQIAVLERAFSVRVTRWLHRRLSR